jgi:hypothetical protein
MIKKFGIKLDEYSTIDGAGMNFREKIRPSYGLTINHGIIVLNSSSITD